MDEYIDQLLAEFTGPPALRKIIQNIIDEPIPEAAKRLLLKPLLPKPIPPVRKQRAMKPKALLAEFDPLLFKKDKNGPLPPILLQKVFANKFLRDYRTVVPLDHGLESDPLSYLSAMESSIETLINGDLTRHRSIKYSAMLTVEFEKLGLTTDNTIKTTAYFRTKANEVLKIGRAHV